MQAGHRSPRTWVTLSVGLCMALTLAAIAAPASAQLPTDNAFAVSATANPPSGTTSDVANCLDFTFTISNDSQNPVGGTNTVTLTLTAAPSGWQYQREPERTYQITQGQSVQPVLTMCPVEGAIQPGSTAVTLTATLEDGLPDGAGPNPQAQATIQASYAEDSALPFDVPSGAIYILAGGLAALVAVILLSRRRIRYGVTLVCPEAEKRLVAGRGTSFPIRIRNEGGERDVVHLRIDPLPPQWDSFVPVTDLSLDPGEEQTVWISVRSPPHANAGEVVTVRISGTSSSAPNEQAILETRAIVIDAPERQRAPAREKSVMDDDIGDDTLIEPDQGSFEQEDRPVAVRRRKD